MAKIVVYYDFHDETIKPFTIVIKFKQGELDWNKNSITVPLEAPFNRFMSEDFSDAVLSASVLLDDLTVNPDKPNQFSIHIPTIKQRYAESTSDLWEIEQLVIRMTDLEEVLQMDPRKYYDWAANKDGEQ